MSQRLLLQPATISVLFLTVSLWFLMSEEPSDSEKRAAWWPGWRLVVLFALWGNVDDHAVIGLAVVALIWLGRLVDSPPASGFWPAFALRAARLAILVVAACANPSHIKNLHLPPELQKALHADESGASQTVNSPFTRAYLSNFGDSAAALSYFPLLGLGALSFLLNRKGWRWAWFLPWLALAIVSGIQVRLVPFFAVVAGPVTAWNLVAYFANHEAPAPLQPRTRYAVQALTGLLAIAFLVCAWPGWLQGPPFEPRRWAVEAPASAQHAATFLHQTHASGLWQSGTRTLHLSPDTAAVFAWFCPEDSGVRDESVVAKLLKPDEAEKARQQLRTLGVSRVVVSVTDTGNSSREVLDRLLGEPEEWPVLHLSGGVVVFGWRDPAQAAGVNPYAGWEVDFTRLAFRPDSSEIAPPTRGTNERRWWDAFWKPAPPPRPAGRDEAIVLLKKSEAMTRSAPMRQQLLWEASQIGGLVGAAGGWITPGGSIDATFRLAFINPPLPENAKPGTALPAITQLTFALQRRFSFDRGETPVGLLYASLRASRRGLAENPNDANAYFILSQTYAALVRTSSEQSWAIRLPQLIRLRQIQASTALNRAIALNPDLAEAHVELARLYLTINYLDLAAVHLRAYKDILANQGGPKQGDRRAEAILAELDRLTEAVNTRSREFAESAGKLSVGDRAAQAAQQGLAGEARDLLLKSDFSAFGVRGMERELDLLLRTGRPEDVLEWMTPELRGSLGDFTYFWIRAQAYIALGEYEAADAELREVVGLGGQLPPPAQIGTEVAGVLGKALLDQQPCTPFTPPFVIRTLSELDFRTRMTQITQKLNRLSDVLVLRGLIALEAGTIDRARESFRAALLYAPERWNAQLEFNGRLVAWECLGLIENAEGKPAQPPK